MSGRRKGLSEIELDIGPRLMSSASSEPGPGQQIWSTMTPSSLPRLLFREATPVPVLETMFFPNMTNIQAQYPSWKNRIKNLLQKLILNRCQDPELSHSVHHQDQRHHQHHQDHPRQPHPEQCLLSLCSSNCIRLPDCLPLARRNPSFFPIPKLLRAVWRSWTGYFVTRHTRLESCTWVKVRSMMNRQF